MTERIKILLVDDDEEDYLITRDIINDITHRRYQLDWVAGYSEAVNVISEKRHQVYLIDYYLGGENGLDLIRTAIRNGCKAPLILLTGQGDIETDESAMKAGAADYLIKGTFTPHDLERAIRYSIQNATNIEEIYKLNIELEERVQKRTAELFEAIKKLEEINQKQRQAEAEVRKALEKERELNELKSRFVTIASHEFRTPLSTILSSASLVSKYNEMGEKDKIEKHIQRIKSSVTNLTGILNDFLSLSKLEEGVIANNPVNFDLSELVEEVVEEMHTMLKPEQRLIYDYRGEEFVILDKQIVRNVLINLVSNAIKYSERGEIKIGIINTGTKTEMVVSDQGIGIPDSDKPFLFTRFFRARNAGNIQGTGLGLNIVKRYVEVLGGNLKFESEQGKGTIFKIEILKQIS
jgi:signal transduction histidine kinase